MKSISRINLAPERPTLDGHELPALFALYLQERSRRTHVKTMAAYAYNARWFVGWWQEAGPSVNYMLDSDALAEFARYLEIAPGQRGSPLSWHTRNHILATLRAMLRWAYKHNYISTDFSRFVPRTKGRPPVQIGTDLQVLAALLEAAGRSRYPARNRAMIAVLAGTGVRCIECAALRVEDVSVYADGSGVLSLAVAKGNRPRLAAFDRHTGAYLVALLDASPGTGPLFRSQYGVHLLPAGVYTLVRKLADRAGVGDRIRGPHDLRRLFATYWARTLPGEGYGHLLQKQMGHAQFSMTTHYLLQDIEDVAIVMRTETATPIAALANATRPLV